MCASSLCGYSSRSPSSHGSESLSRRGQGGPVLTGYDGRVCSASERPSKERSADRPCGAQASQQGVKRSLLASEADCFDAFLAEKVLGKDGFCYQGQTTPRRTDLDRDQISLKFTTGLQNWYLNGSHGLDKTNRPNSRCE